jgi:predicted DsbA family dithiol-disulfide isomerase
MRIDIWSDIVCPWCYIGETRFDRALAQFDGKVEIRRHPFQLDPEAPIPGVPALERYQKKFGDDAPDMLERVTSEASREGLTFNFDTALTANTIDAHRALAFARARGKEHELENSLFAAYFTEGLDISDRAVLARRGAGVGLDEAELAAYLESDAGVDELRREFAASFEAGITSVPSFVFNGEFLVPGAVDTPTFLRILEQMRDVA